MTAEPVTREEIHHRQIDLRGYRRSDGLFEVSAHLIDRKPRDFTPHAGNRTISAHSPIHDLGVTLTIASVRVVSGRWRVAWRARRSAHRRGLEQQDSRTLAQLRHLHASEGTARADGDRRDSGDGGLSSFVAGKPRPRWQADEDRQLPCVCRHARSGKRNLAGILPARISGSAVDFSYKYASPCRGAPPCASRKRAPLP
jgi:hypothetical protein